MTAETQHAQTPLCAFDALNGRVILYSDCVVIRHSHWYAARFLKQVEPAVYLILMDDVTDDTFVLEAGTSGEHHLIVHLHDGEILNLRYGREASRQAYRLLDTLKRLRTLHGTASV